MKWIKMLAEIKANQSLLDSRPDLSGMGEDSQVFKAFLAAKQEAPEENTLIATISTKAKDAYGDIVEPKGGDFTRWRKNPVVMWAHDYKLPPIGRGLWIKTDSAVVISKCEYAPSEFAQQIYKLSIPSKQNGGMPWIQGWSIGFLPTEAEWITEKDDDGEDKSTGGIRFLKWELLEYSECPIPANPESLTNAIVKGILKVENKDILKQLQDAAVQDSTTVTVKTQTFKYCVCKDCGYWEEKKAGKPCQDKKCPDCGKPLMGSNDKPKKEVEGQPASKEAVDADAEARKAEINNLVESLKARVDGHLKSMGELEDKESEEYVKLDAQKKLAENELQLILDCKEDCDLQITSAGKKEKLVEPKKDKITVAVKIDGMEIVEDFRKRLEKAGAVLNKANKEKLKKASDSILEVLASAEKEDNKVAAQPEPKKEEPEKTDILSEIKIEDKAPVKLEATAEEVSAFQEKIKGLLEETNEAIRGVVKQEVRKLLGKVDI